MWNPNDNSYRTESAWDAWNTAYNYLSASKANRQIDFDRLYAANEGANEQGADAMYYIQARHNNQLDIKLSSTLDMKLASTASKNLRALTSSATCPTT